MKVSTSEEVSKTVTVVLEGRLDAPAAIELRSALDGSFAKGDYDLIVDLTNVSFIDSAGLAALVRAMKASRSAGADLRLVRPRDAEAFRVFTLTKFDSVFTFVEGSQDRRKGEG